MLNRIVLKICLSNYVKQWIKMEMIEDGNGKEFCQDL